MYRFVERVYAWYRPAARVDVRPPAGPPLIPLERMGPGRYDPVAHEAIAEIAASAAPYELPAPAWALAELDSLRGRLAKAERLTAPTRERLTELTAQMPTTEAGLVSELAAVRADRDRLEEINDRLRAELAELREKAGV